MRKRIFTFLIISLFIVFQLTSQTSTNQGIKWHTLNEAFELAKTQPRPIILDVYTDWCSWCKYMMKTTFSNKGIVNYINTYFYAAKFDAETLDTVDFQGIKYFNRKVGRQPTHDLAIKLLEGQLSYPSVVYFDRQGKKTVIPGYKEPKDIEPILVYFAENLNNTVGINEFYINFMFTFPNSFEKDHSIFKIDRTLKPDTLGNINWSQTSEIQKINNKKKRPVLMYFYTDWCVSCKVMEKTSFGDMELAEKINSNYYSVKINAASTETINFLGKSYAGKEGNQPNEITYQFLKENLQMPALVVLDENYNVLTRINGYLLKDQLIPLTEYFYNKSYKKTSLQEYLKAYMTEKKAKQEKEKAVN